LIIINATRTHPWPPRDVIGSLLSSLLELDDYVPLFDELDRSGTDYPSS